MSNTIEQLTAVCPSERQHEWQKLEFTAFFHFGMNTFTDAEWGDGTENPKHFNPTDINTDQWCEGLISAGIKACIITAKHHDGFCLWPSAYTEHSVKNSPFKKDVVKLLAESCKKYGLKLGVYLSPWDRNNPAYGFGKAYDDYFCNQLNELLSNYGDIYTVWFDGACGEGTNGKKQVYDWERYYALIRKLQPSAVISVCGPDVRWCGNEAGDCRSSEWSVVPGYLSDNEKISGASQQADDGKFREKKLSTMDSDLGSRAVVTKADKLIWYPAEVDTSIRPGWFYHKKEDKQVRPLDTLINIYLKSVGGNSVLLLNIPPDTRGRLSDADITRLNEIGSYIKSIFANELTKGAAISTNSTESGFDITSVLHDNDISWKACDGAESCCVEISLENAATVRYAVVMEDITRGQRIEEFSLEAQIDNVWEVVYKGTTVGYKRICKLESPAKAQNWRFKVDASRICPTLLRLALY